MQAIGCYFLAGSPFTRNQDGAIDTGELREMVERCREARAVTNDCVLSFHGILG